MPKELTEKNNEIMTATALFSLQIAYVRKKKIPAPPEHLNQNAN